MNAISKSEVLKVMKQLGAVNKQIGKTVESVGVDYYGIVRVHKEELEFWQKQFSKILDINTSIKVRYKTKE